MHTYGNGEKNKYRIQTLQKSDSPRAKFINDSPLEGLSVNLETKEVA